MVDVVEIQELCHTYARNFQIAHRDCTPRSAAVEGNWIVLSHPLGWSEKVSLKKFRRIVLDDQLIIEFMDVWKARHPGYPMVSIEETNGWFRINDRCSFSSYRRKDFADLIARWKR